MVQPSPSTSRQRWLRGGVEVHAEPLDLHVAVCGREGVAVADVVVAVEDAAGVDTFDKPPDAPLMFVGSHDQPGWPLRFASPGRLVLAEADAEERDAEGRVVSYDDVGGPVGDDLVDLLVGEFFGGEPGLAFGPVVLVNRHGAAGRDPGGVVPLPAEASWQMPDVFADLATAIIADWNGVESVELLVIAIDPPQSEIAGSEPTLHLAQVLGALRVEPEAEVADLQDQVCCEGRGVVDDGEPGPRVCVEVADNQNPPGRCDAHATILPLGADRSPGAIGAARAVHPTMK